MGDIQTCEEVKQNAGRGKTKRGTGSWVWGTGCSVFSANTSPESVWIVRIAFGMGSGCLSEIRVAKANEPGCHFERCVPPDHW